MKYATAAALAQALHSHVGQVTTPEQKILLGSVIAKIAAVVADSGTRYTADRFIAVAVTGTYTAPPMPASVKAQLGISTPRPKSKRSRPATTDLASVVSQLQAAP